MNKEEAKQKATEEAVALFEDNEQVSVSIDGGGMKNDIALVFTGTGSVGRENAAKLRKLGFHFSGSTFVEDYLVAGNEGQTVLTFEYIHIPKLKEV